MAFQWISDNVTEVAVTGRWSNSRDIVTVLHVKREEDDPGESARDVLNNWQDHLVPGFADNYVLQGAHFADHNALEGATGFVLPDAGKPVVGGEAGAAPPANVAILVHKHIAAHANVRSGRMYLPPTTEANIDENGILTPVEIAAYNEQLQSFFDGLHGGGGNQLGVVHKKDHLVSTSDFDVCTGLTVDPLIATMRRRIRR